MSAQKREISAIFVGLILLASAMAILSVSYISGMFVVANDTFYSARFSVINPFPTQQAISRVISHIKNL